MRDPMRSAMNDGGDALHDALRDPNEHTLLEDAYALFTGCTMIALGLVLMRTGGITTAGMAGVALLLSYQVPLGIGALFFLLNIPFLLLGKGVLGRAFLIKTVIALALIFGLATLASAALRIEYVHPAFAALAGGTCSGVGILALIRHNTGVGGVNIVALWAQRKHGWNVGKLHIALDGLILLAAGLTLSPQGLGWSVLSMLAVNLVLVAYHKPGRYLGH